MLNTSASGVNWAGHAPTAPGHAHQRGRTYAGNVINTQKLKSAGRRRRLWLHWGPRNVCRCWGMCICVRVSCRVCVSVCVLVFTHTKSQQHPFCVFVIKNQLQDIFRPDSRQRNYNLSESELLYSQVRVYTAIFPATCKAKERETGPPTW